MNTQTEKEKLREERRQLSEQKRLAQRNSSIRSAEINPCLEEHELSFKCINENMAKEDACVEHFENYKICKSFWYTVQRQRRRLGITPDLPDLEERKKIKEKYFKQAYGK